MLPGLEVVWENTPILKHVLVGAACPLASTGKMDHFSLQVITFKMDQLAGHHAIISQCIVIKSHWKLLYEKGILS